MSRIVFDFFTYIIFTYSVALLVLYILIGFFSVGIINKYTNKNSFTNYKLLAVSPYAPSISILAPAYNEGANIIENVRSLLSIYYNNIELIVINDGSKDNSLAQLIKAYDLIKIDYFVIYQIPTKEVRGVYKSKNPVYKKLVVVDKVNGGKADALNVGINIASNDYIVCIDVDCVLAPDAFLKLMKPFLDATGKRVIATGGVVRIANSCEIKHGRLLKVHLPKQYLPRMQALEYIRAFLLARMAWSRLNGLMLISGAFGAFDKEIAIKAGGYNHKTVGEDMELVVRMRRYMEELKIPYIVAFIPDPLCWTEAPTNYKILGRQRNRWARGTIETLGIHKKMFFNPNYHLLGMLSYPFWFFFEMCAPGIEFIGIVAFIIMALLKMIYWPTFIAFLVFIISFGYLYSAFAIFMEVKTYNQYKRRTDVMKLLLTALTEPFVFHPFVVWSGVRGYVDKIRKKSGWGEMTRQGLNGNYQPVAIAEPEAEPVQEAVIQTPPPAERPGIKQKENFLPKLKTGLQHAAKYNLVVITCLLIIKLFELVRDVQLHGMPADFYKLIGYGAVSEVSFFIKLSLFSILLFTALFLVNKKLAQFAGVFFSVCIVVIHAALTQYFLSTLVPLGADLFSYSFAEIHQTVGASGSFTLSFILIAILFSIAVIAIFIWVPRKIKLNINLTVTLLILFAAAYLFSPASILSSSKNTSELIRNHHLNKSDYFYSSTYNYFLNTKNDELLLTNKNGINYTPEFAYTDEAHFPFLRKVDTSIDVLSPFFNKQATPPNFVFVVVEGLGRAFSNKDAFLGSFTPYLDSLSEKSLYWPNFLSSGGRTFAMLPSLFGSLPYAKNGFLEMGDKMPAHLSLLNILKKQGYSTSFSYGGDASFDNMSVFLNKNGCRVIEKKSYSSRYQTMPSNNGFSWGYGDEEVFDNYHETNNSTQPYCNIILTLSTHNPFLVQNQDKYINQFEQRMQTLGFSETKKQEHRFYKNQYASILYADNAIRNFINTYSKRADFSNTIFIITGDHQMPELPIATKIGRYHVPLIIYSPLLKRSKTFNAVSSHLDVTPSILSFVGHQFNYFVPHEAAWMGGGLDTANAFRNTHAYPLMQTKNDLVDFLMGDYMLNGNDLYKLGNNMDLEPVKDEAQKKKLQYAFALFHQKNNMLLKGTPLIPDSMIIK